MVRQILACCLGFMHEKRWEALVKHVDALLRGSSLSVTGLGRSAHGRALIKHRIKSADRLVGNARLQREMPLAQRELARSWILRSKQCPIILVDWTAVGDGLYALTASVAFTGRAVPLYHEVFHEKKKTNRKVEAQFLRNLSQCLGPHCKPTIVTDAGFYTEWFDTIEQLGWHFVGRIRNKTMYRTSAVNPWIPVNSLHGIALTQAQCLGRVVLTKTKPRTRRLVLIRKPKSYAHPKSRRYSTTANKCRRRAAEPWLLATSLEHRPKEIVRIYALRMQIEQNYRDIKNPRWGWSLRHHLSGCPRRVHVLLFLAAVAMVIVFLVGLHAEQQGIHRTYQANTYRDRRVLSLFFLGIQLLRHGHVLHSKKFKRVSLDLVAALDGL